MANAWQKGAKKRQLVIQQAEATASDMMMVAEEMKKLPPGQLKKFLTPEILEILGKYGISMESH